MTESQVRTRQAGGAAPGPQQEGWPVRALRAFATPAGVIALVMIAVQAGWRGRELLGGYFTQDDFVLLRRASQDALGVDHLLAEYAGELSPVGSLISWLVASGGPRDWGTAAAVVLVLQAVAALLTWLVLSRILEDRWVRLPLLAVACFTPLTLPATMWWALALMHLPTVVLLLVAVLGLLARIKDGWQSGLVVSAAAMTLALLCSSHSLVLPLALFFVAAGMEPETTTAGGAPLSVLARLRAATRRHVLLWTWLVAVVAGRVALEVWLDRGHLGWPSDASTVTDVVEQYARQGVSGLVGGPWTGDVLTTVLVPTQNWPLGVAALVCLLLAVPVLRAPHPVARVSVLGLVTYFVAGALLLVLVQEGVGVLGVASRFLADLVTVVVVLLAVALRKAPVPPEIRRVVSMAPPAVALVLTAGYIASAAVTTAALVPELRNEDDQAYVDNIATGLDDDPRAVLLDAVPPEGVLSGLFGDVARLSTVTSTMPQDPPFDAPSEYLRMVDQGGLVREVDLVDPLTAEAPPTEDCGYPVRARGTLVRMQDPVPEEPQVMRLGYYTKGDTFAEVELPEGVKRFPARNGVHVIDVPVQGGFDRFTIAVESLDQTVCLTGVQVGRPVPAPLPPAS